VVVFAERWIHRVADEALFVLIDDLDAAVVGQARPEEGQLLGEKGVELELPGFGPTAHIVEHPAVQVGFGVIGSAWDSLFRTPGFQPTVISRAGYHPDSSSPSDKDQDEPDWMSRRSWQFLFVNVGRGFPG